MKKMSLAFFFSMTLLFVFQFVQATSEPSSLIPAKDMNAGDPKPSILSTMAAKQFIAMTPKKYQQMTGKKMTLSQKIALKIAQHKVKRQLKKGLPVDMMAMGKEVDTSNFNFAGFLLGLILGIIGVLIAYLIGDRNMIQWAWIGFAIWVGIVLLILIL